MAIRVSDADRKEAELQALDRVKEGQIAIANCTERMDGMFATYVLEEDVFIAQLTARARLLNAEFQERVLLAIRAHAASPDRLSSDSGMHFATLERSGSIVCSFAGGGLGNVAVHAAPPKRAGRIREKLSKYTAPDPRAVWPLCANILDPIRVSVVCENPAQMLEVLSWFTWGEAETGLQVCRIKNKFAFHDDQVCVS